MTTIVFRADASTAIGTGHVMRCATLAETLATRGAAIHFVCRTDPGNLCDWLQGRGFWVHRLPPESPAADSTLTQSAIAGIGEIDWLVVDHYQLDRAWESALRQHAKRLLVIDDLANRPHDCDLLLDQNFLPEQDNRYRQYLPTTTRQLLGPRYALLRQEFALARQRQGRRDGRVEKVLVCFGGSDPKAYTLAALKALHPHASRLSRIDVVVGTANPHLAAIVEACAALPQAVIHAPAENMAALLAECDLAVGAGGIMNWERACLRIPTIAFGIADNQVAGLSALLAGGCVLGVAHMPQPEPQRMTEWLASTVDNPPLLRGLAARSAMLVDGQGVERVADHLLRQTLEFRPVSLTDSDQLFLWRNAPAVRAVSLDSSPIERQTHETWLRQSLANPQRILLIAERGGQPLGVVRFDLAAPQALISVYRTPLPSGRCALIEQASLWLQGQHPEIQRIVAEVLPQNQASLAAFRAAGYRDRKNTLVFERESI